MATPITFNGASYNVPAYGDSGWAQGAGNLSSYLIAIAAGTLQTTGGTFTLSAETYFGAGFGIRSLYFKTATILPSTSGVVRLATGDSIGWRNNANGANVLLSKDASDNLQWNGSTLLTSALFASSEKREVYIAGTPLNNYTGSLTVVNMVSAYYQTGKNLNVFVNGLCQDVTYDYAETSTLSITFGSALNIGDRISLRWAQA